MATSRLDIQRWFETARSQRATHIIVACDTFDLSDYPVYVSAVENVRDRELELKSTPMTKVMEVYSLSMDMETQINEERAFHYD